MSTLVTKADGSTEYYKVEKLRRSLRRAGASNDEVSSIVNEIDGTLYDGITTREIYQRAFALLREHQPPAATKYSLRRALFGLGPTGFPFEEFIARVFQAEGYSAEVGTQIAGRCAEHEIDIAAYKEDHSFICEAKFHSRAGRKSDLQVAMYCYARLLDLKDKKICVADHCGIKEFLLVTNTKFTSSAERYAECVGLKMLSWDYPVDNNLHDYISRTGIYPITVLQSLSNSQLQTLIARNIIVCRDLIDNPNILRHLHLSTRKQEQILSEVKSIFS